MYRIGQTKHVYIRHLIIRNSVEERIMELTADQLNAAMNTGTEKDETEQQQDTRIGAIMKDNYQLKMEQLLLLFKS